MGLNKRKNHFTLLLNIYTEACCIKRFFSLMVIKLTDPIHDMCISHGGNKMGSNQDADFWDRGTRESHTVCSLFNSAYCQYCTKAFQYILSSYTSKDVQRPNSWTKSRQKTWEFSSLLFTVTSTIADYRLFRFFVKNVAVTIDVGILALPQFFIALISITFFTSSWGWSLLTHT